MAWHQTFGLAAAAVSFLGYPLYALDFLGPGTSPVRQWFFRVLGLRGGTQPRLVSWVVWAAVQGVIFAGARAQGATDTNYLPLAYFIGCSGVAVLALRFGNRVVTRLDAACGLLAGVSLLLLVLAEDPVTALFLAIFTDTVAGLPTLVAVARDPRSESLTAWAVFLVGGMLNVLAFPSLNPATWTFEVVGYTLVVISQQGFVVGRILVARLR